MPSKGVSCVSLGFGALLREKHLVSPPLQSHPTQLTRCVTPVPVWCWVVKWGWWHAAVILGSQAVSQWVTPWRLPAEPPTGVLFLIWSCFSGILPNPAPSPQCASVPSAERARGPASAGLKKDTYVPKWWFYFFSFYVCMGNCG